MIFGAVIGGSIYTSWENENRTSVKCDAKGHNFEKIGFLGRQMTCKGCGKTVN